jgi:hypothetical protein
MSGVKVATVTPVTLASGIGIMALGAFAVLALMAIIMARAAGSQRSPYLLSQDEVAAYYKNCLQALRQQQEKWRQRALQLGELEDTELAAALERYQRLEARTAEHVARLTQATHIKQLRSLTQDITRETEQLQLDLTQCEERAIARAAKARERQRRLRENAAAAYKALQSRAQTENAPPVAPELLRDLNAIAQAKYAGDAEAMLAQALAQLTRTAAPAPETLSAAQRELAQKLQADPLVTLEAWLHNRPPDTPRDERLARIDRHIAELQLLQGAQSAEDFLLQLQKAEAEEQPQQRQLLLDSLVLNLVQTTRDSRQKRAQLARLQELAAALPPAQETLRAQIAACTLQTETAHLTRLLETCNAVIDAYLQQQDLLARRQAVLSGLASLGYEVRENMATLWADSGKVLLRNTATPGYGLEISGKTSDGRMQTRLVALTKQHDTRRDRDIETLWRNNFNRLQPLLAEQGYALNLERASSVEEAPLKEVDNATGATEQEAQKMLSRAP